MKKKVVAVVIAALATGIIVAVKRKKEICEGKLGGNGHEII